MAYFPGVGAFEHLFGSGSGEFEHQFSKNSNARGLPGGEGDVEIDWYIRKTKHYKEFLIVFI